MNGPVVHVTPVTGHTTLSIEGYVANRNGVASLKINGRDIDLDYEDRFGINILETDHIEFVAVNNAGYTSRQVFSNDSVMMEEGIAVRLNNKVKEFMICTLYLIL